MEEIVYLISEIMVEETSYLPDSLLYIFYQMLIGPTPFFFFTRKKSSQGSI